jgi:hypothetical protein
MFLCLKMAFTLGFQFKTNPNSEFFIALLVKIEIKVRKGPKYQTLICILSYMSRF